MAGDVWQELEGSGRELEGASELLEAVRERPRPVFRVIEGGGEPLASPPAPTTREELHAYLPWQESVWFPEVVRLTRGDDNA